MPAAVGRGSDAGLAYVDLNPVRAGVSKTPESSEFTTAYDRIKRLKKPKVGGACPDGGQKLNYAERRSAASVVDS